MFFQRYQQTVDKHKYFFFYAKIDLSDFPLKYWLFNRFLGPCFVK